MKEYINQIVVIPIITLYYLIGIFLFDRFALSIDYLLFGLFVIGGVIIQFIKNKFNSNKVIKVLCALVTVSIVIFIYYDLFSDLGKGLYLSIVNSDISHLRKFASTINSVYLIKYSLYFAAFVLVRITYSELIEKKNITLFADLAIITSICGGVLQGRTDPLVLSLLIISLLLRVFSNLYNDINNLNYRKSIVILIVFIFCSIISYFVVPYAENINVRNVMLNVRTTAEELYEKYIEKEIGLDARLSDRELLSNNGELSDEVILTISTSYHFDKLKSYSCDSFDIKNNAFVINKTIEKENYLDFSDLFIRQDNMNLTEYMHVDVNKKVDNIVYVPYGELSISEKAYLYDDKVIQFKNNKNYGNYSLTFNPDSSFVSGQDKLLDDYKQYVYEKYVSSAKTLPKEIEESINLFIYEDYDLYNLVDDSTLSKEEIDIRKIENINNYLNKKFVIGEEYNHNNRINDISNALENEHVANQQLLAAIATFMYRYEGIPARFVVGYLANDYQDNILYIHENDKAFWTEVFLQNRWIPINVNSDGIDLNNDEDSKSNSVESTNKYTTNNEDSFIDESISGSEDEDSVVLIVETNHPVDRIKQTSYGDYDPSKQCFMYEEDINMFDSIKRAGVVNNLQDYFYNLFVFDEPFDYYMKVTSYLSSKSAFVPYGKINVSNATMYQDKAIVFNEITDSYLISFKPYDKENLYKTNSIYEDYVYEKYLAVPNDMVKELQDFLISKGIDYKSNDKSLLIRQIKDLLQGKEYRYTLEPGRVPKGKDVLLYFLLENKQGFCQHFAGAATLLYRVCGIPSRYTVGFAVDDYVNGVAVITANKGHAWTEVYTKNNGWKPVEVTGSKRNNTLEYEVDYISDESIGDEFDDETNIRNVSGLSQESNNYNTQPNTALSNQIIDRNKTYIDKTIEEDDNKVLAIIKSDKKINRIKGYAYGNYDVDNQKFFLGEDISNFKEIKKISELYNIDTYFISLFTNKNEYENKIEVSIIDGDKWIYVPYGMINIDDASMYQDKYLYYEDETNYDNYELLYSLDEYNREFNSYYDYENFVYSYYTKTPYDFDLLLKDYLEEKKIDIDSNDKLSIIKKIQEIFTTDYIYKKTVSEPKDGTDRTLHFIIRSREGDDELFANAATLLLRLCSIPTRCASGYYFDDYNGNEYKVTSDNYHTWIEVYTSNYGWMPVEICPDYVSEDVDNYKFERHINEEDDIEFVDIQKKHNSSLYFLIAGIVSFVCLVAVILIKIKNNRDEYNRKLEMLGIATKEQYLLLKEINRNYMILKNNGYVNDIVENIMLRIRFSPRKESKDDLDALLKQVEFMKQDIKNNKKSIFKRKK